MHHSSITPIFEDRFDAGHKLAEKLLSYKDQQAVVLGIPNGGAAVALGVALALNADLDLIISRKIPLPLSPEGGFGSITDDGTMILNEDIVKQAGLTRQQVNYQASRVRADIRQRSLLYHGEKRPLALTRRIVIIVDDGLASGYTMRAAIESMRHRNPAKIIAAVPVGPERIIEEVRHIADSVVTCAAGTQKDFYLSDYYRMWQDISDAEVLACLKEWRIRHGGQHINLRNSMGRE
ncbi:MAG TPA: phosphoribosyltransferase family protein [Dehalococcoidales bacterium]|nr:phosphoribosyltransferase family protein [Dehalococcoidales bacterium]